MVVIGAPQPWPPPPPSPPLPLTLPSYDCSLSGCSSFCPPHCDILTPPITDPSPSSHLSPLMVALITLLASAFLLLCYYTVISRYCKRRRDEIRRRRDRVRIEQLELESRLDQLIYDSTTNTAMNHHRNNTNSSTNNGLDERTIKAITVFKYRRGEGIIEGTDCAVCLSEFRDSESLRLMPNCQHAFHVDCIDTWLKSQSNCPICRSGMLYQANPPAPATTTTTVSAMRVERGAAMVVVRDLEESGGERCEIEIGEVNCGGER